MGIPAVDVHFVEKMCILFRVTSFRRISTNPVIQCLMPSIPSMHRWHSCRSAWVIFEYANVLIHDVWTKTGIYACEKCSNAILRVYHGFKDPKNDSMSGLCV